MLQALRYPVVVALFIAGCTAGPHPGPADATSQGKDRRPAAELVQRGREAASRGDAVRAEQYLSLAIEQGADRRFVLPLLLHACLRSSHLRAALNHAEPYLLDHPEDDTLRYLVAVIHLGLGQIVPARRELGLLLQRDEYNSDAHYLLGIIESTGNIAAAKAHFLRVVERSKDEEQKIEVQSRLAELNLRESERPLDANSSVRQTGAQP